MTLKQWLPPVLCALAAALALGLAGEAIEAQFMMDVTTYLLLTALLVFILVTVNVRLHMPQRTFGDDVAFVYPVHWATFFPLGVLLGLLVGGPAARYIGGRLFAGTIHTYEAVGLFVGGVVVVLMAIRRSPFSGAAFGLGYGLALASAILLLDPQNAVLTTYAGHLGVMAALSALGIVFGRLVRIQIID